MNRIYRSLWNEATRTFVAVAENIRACGGRSSSVQESPRVKPGIRRSAIRPLALEQRFMFDGAAVATGIEAAATAHATPDTPTVDHVPAPQAVVFVDARLQDKGKLLTNVAPNTEVVVLDQQRDGLDQMAAYLADHHDVGSVQILAHGWAGNLWLGNTFVDQSALQSHQGDLTAIGQALKPGGDILVYACDTAAGSDGLAFVNTLSQLTGADVAASDNRTGTGGDWNLEIATGSIEAASALSNTAMANYDHSLATRTVTSNQDNGAAGTLRYEINNATAGDTITFASSMTIAVTTNQGGHLYISKSLTIEGDIDGNGTADVTLDGAYKTDLIYISNPVTAPTVTLDGLILERGLLAGDGGSYNLLDGGSALGAAIHVSNGTTTISHSQIIGNVATGGGGNGGVISGYSYGGGGGSGFNGQGGGRGGNGSPINWGGLGGSGQGGIGGNFGLTAMAGKGGTSGTTGAGGAGGLGGAIYSGYSTAGAGGKAGNGTIGYVGGGGGGSGSATASAVGNGGSAVGGLYVASGATVFMADTTLSQNLGAGGGGAGSCNNADGGGGGAAAGGILVKGTLHYQSSSVTFTDDYGTGGKGGNNENGWMPGSDGASNNNVLTLSGGATDSNWNPTSSTTISAAFFSNDTGTNTTDLVTQTAAQNITGTLSANLVAGESVKVSLDGGSTWTTATANVGTNIWSLSGVTLTGSGTLEAKVANSYGGGTIYSHAYSLDTTAPSITFSNLALSVDTGPSSTDFITNTASQIITATLSAAPAGTDIVYGSLDNGTTWTNITSKVSGTTLTWNGVTLSGSNALMLKVTDNAGNAGTAKSQTYTVDTLAPTITFSNLALSADTGTSPSDFITNTASQTVTATLSAAPAGTDVVYGSLDNGVTWSNITSKVSGTTLTWDGITLSGSNTLKLKVSDTAGNDGPVKLQTYTLDTTAPTITFSNLALSSDTGPSSSDFITNTASQTITATLSAAPAGTDVVYGSLDNGATWSNITSKVSGTTLTWNGVTLSGSNSLKLKVTDNAGNDGTVKLQGYTLDTAAPTTTIASAAFANDTGTSSTDFVTKTASQTISGTLSANLAAGELVYVSLDNGSTWTVATATVGQSTWVLSGATLSGSDTLKVKVSDTAGNDGTVFSQAYVLDTTAPTITFSNLALSSDTGPSGTDFITNTASQTVTATLSAAPAGTDVVYGSLDNGTTWTNITSKVSGTTLTWNGVTLSGSNTLKLKVTDSAGNDGTVKSQAFTFDNTAPSAPSTPAMTAATDTGSSTSDGITNNTVPSFTGTAEAGSTVTLYDTDGVTVLGTTTATGGSWSITSSPLSVGDHTLSAKATDLAGNTSTASSSLAVVIDTVAPAGLAMNTTTVASSTTSAGAIIATLSATDTQSITYGFAVGNGSNDADNGKFAIAGNGLKVGGSALTAGTYHINLKAMDSAGNVAYQAFTLTVVDAPSVSTIVRTGGASATVATGATSLSYTVTFDQAVTGVDASDFTLTTTGTAAGTIASVTGSGTTYAVTVNGISGDGTLRLDLNGSGTGIQNGTSVGIFSGYSAGATYTLDHTAPAAPSVPDLASASDTGTSNTDNLSNVTAPTFTGTAESGSTVTLYDTDGTTVLGTGTAAAGNWSITSATLSGGSHVVTAKAVDAAGNVSLASSALTVTVDTTAPAVASVFVPTNDSYRAGQTLIFTVAASEAVTVDTAGGTPRLALNVGGSTVYASYASGSGTSALVFTYTVQAGDSDGDGIAVAALQTNGGALRDTAGNDMMLSLHSVASTSGVLVDTTAPTVTSVAVPTGGTYYIGQNLDFTVNFSEALTVDTAGGTPHVALTLNTGGTVYANYVSGAGTSALLFRHVVALGELDTNGIAVGALSANGGTLTDTAGNDATLTLNSVASTASVNVDGSLPTVTNVTASTADGTYKAGDVVSIAVSFDKAVTVDTTSGRPTLALADGGSAIYVSGSGTGTLVFSYTVRAGENSADLDYSATGALALNGGTITANSGSHPGADLTLAVPGGAGSLGANKAIVIDTTPPAITFSNLAFSADSGASSSDFITRTASQTITATLSAAPAGTDVVYGSLDGGVTWTDITSKVSGTTLTWNGVTLTGSNTLMLKVADAVGNDGAIKSQIYALDTAAPVVTVGTLTSASTTPVLTGTANEGTLTVTVGGATYTVTATGGAWSLDLAHAVPTHGKLAIDAGRNYAVDISAVDAAGNTSAASGTLNVIAITRVPPPPITATADPVQSTPAEPIILPTPRAVETPQSFLSPNTENALGNSIGSHSLFGISTLTPEHNDIVPRPSSQPGASVQGVVVHHTMADQVIVTAGGTAEISVPTDTFAQFGSDSHLQLVARQADGRPLPNWISFDPVRGKFMVKAPPGVSGDLVIRLTARDAQGRETSTAFKIRVGTDTASQERAGRSHFSGRASLSDQIRAARPAHRMQA